MWETMGYEEEVVLENRKEKGSNSRVRTRRAAGTDVERRSKNEYGGKVGGRGNQQ